jgi:pimeloyl-ACP methyl ester carboxylesterase
MSQIDAHGQQIRYREWGEDRPGDPVILIHGAGMGSIVWLDVGKQLGAMRRTIAIDLPGHGQSGKLPHKISIEAYRDSVGIFCAAMGIEKAILCGHSMGGAIALQAAMEWPEKVSALVLCATGARLTVGSQLLDLIREQFSALPRLLEAVAYSPSTPADVVSRWAQTVLQAPQEVVLADFLACEQYDARERLTAGVPVPSLVIGAEDDLLAPPKYATYLAGQIAGAKLLIMERAGHHLMHERPEEFVQAVLGFLGNRSKN